MSPRPGTLVRPTGRGVVVAGLCAGLWVLGDLARVAPARQLAAALLLMLVIGAIGIAVSSVGLRVHRHLVDDAVPVGATARVMLELAGPAWITTVPLGRGIVREHLPEPLGGQGDLPLATRMPHVLHVGRRGGHDLGPCSIIVRDLLGMFHLRRTIDDGLRLTGLPVIGELPPATERAAGISREGAGATAAAPGVGEIGPIARPYASGDDIRRIHWRASARTGQLMTREDEPAAGQSAVIMLDTTRRDGLTPQLEDALVSHAATLLASLTMHGWEVRVVDAAGDEITRIGRSRGANGHSPLGREADAVERRAALFALADVVFDDDAAGGIGQDHAAGDTAFAIALGPDDGDPFSGLELDRFAGRAAHRTAIALRPASEDDQAGAEDSPRPPSRRLGPGDGDDFGTSHEQHARELAAGRDGRGRRAVAGGSQGPVGGGGPSAAAGSGLGSVAGGGPSAVGGGDHHEPTRSALGTWELVRGTDGHTLTALLAADAEPVR